MSFPIRGATMGRALAGLLREIRGDNIGARPSNTPRDTPIQPNISPDFSNVDPLLNDTDSTNQYANLLERNSLDDYTNTKYHIELSLVGDVTNVNTSQKALRDHDVLHFIASSDLTDASEDRELRPESEFFITKFSFKTFPSVTSRSPESVDTVMMNMHIQEPHGFSFDKAVRRAARLINSDSTNGEVNPSRLIFRVDLWFSGYTKDGEFVQKIPVTNPFPSVRGATVEIDREGVPDLDTLEGNQAQYSTQDQYTFFTSIHALDAKIDKAGTSYIAQMIEVRDVPRASEYDTFDNENVELPEGESTLE
ncbi:hypothetical protein CL653_03670, partial [bacterium]|nr:hypothetical protein [bacterium]